MNSFVVHKHCYNGSPCPSSQSSYNLQSLFDRSRKNDRRDTNFISIEIILRHRVADALDLNGKTKLYRRISLARLYLLTAYPLFSHLLRS